MRFLARNDGRDRSWLRAAANDIAELYGEGLRRATGGTVEKSVATHRHWFVVAVASCSRGGGEVWLYIFVMKRRSDRPKILSGNEVEIGDWDDYVDGQVITSSGPKPRYVRKPTSPQSRVVMVRDEKSGRCSIRVILEDAP